MKIFSPLHFFAIGFLSGAVHSTATAAEITLIYDESSNPEPSAEMYYSSNWDPVTGRPAPGWSEYERRPMFDDGQHGDGEAGDGVWAVKTEVAPDATMLFEWAVDDDGSGDNGWLGTGVSFQVTGDEPQTIPFMEPPLEAQLTRTELEQRFGIDLTKAAAPIPVHDGEIFVFTTEAPDAEQVFLAGSFNGFANNDNGVVKNPRFRMFQLDNGLWTRILKLPHGTVRYKYVLWNEQDGYTWIPDPAVEVRDSDDNTILDLRSLMPERYIASIPGRNLKAPELEPLPMTEGIEFADIDAQYTWVRPGQSHRVTFTLTEEPPEGGIRLKLRKSRDLLNWDVEVVTLTEQTTTYRFSPKGVERPIILDARLWPSASEAYSDQQIIVLPVTENPSDDLRYGFYANWDEMAEDYAAKTDMLADMLINAVEYYDYFPAHGIYAPPVNVYEFEPFYGRRIWAEDVKEKIESGHQRNILAIAYVAAYAASKSVYDRRPHPMTNERGEPLIFNGAVTTEEQADAAGEQKWFWLMAIASDSPWYSYIMEEWERTLIDNPEDLVAFDGLEIDSYGHSPNARYYSEGSERNGELLADVIADLIEDAWRMAHRVKETAAVSFNCVNEFGIERMYDITDFIFIENWAGHKSGIEETIEICYRHREPTGQRVVLKMYPADAGFEDPAYFPSDNLRLMMGMCIAGGGSLMIAGEPNELTGEMHALNTLYYPDNVAIPAENAAIIRDYNLFDAKLYGYNHGRMVKNYPTTLYIPGCAVRGFENPAGDITVTLLNSGDMATWDTVRPEPAPITNREIAIAVPEDREFSHVLYLSPDDSDFHLPVSLDFERKDGYIRTIAPHLHTTGALILKTSASGG